jgi:hypothetical protein
MSNIHALSMFILNSPISGIRQTSKEGFPNQKKAKQRYLKRLATFMVKIFISLILP